MYRTKEVIEQDLKVFEKWKRANLKKLNEILRFALSKIKNHKCNPGCDGPLFSTICFFLDGNYSLVMDCDHISTNISYGRNEEFWKKRHFVSIVFTVNDLKEKKPDVLGGRITKGIKDLEDELTRKKEPYYGPGN